MLPDQLDILLVQDHPAEVELTMRPLTELGAEWRIGVARDGEEALDYLMGRGEFRHRSGAPLPALILLDLKLPKLDGLEVLRALRGSHRTSTAPVVVLTSSREPRELTQCYQLGANSCVHKPVDFSSFYGTIQAVGRYWLRVNQSPPAASAPVARAAGRPE
ncbi:MAG: response regulator [Gemmatimonadales bacterium]|nr:response regulator [Gemmatimonadales bacterium]